MWWLKEAGFWSQGFSYRILSKIITRVEYEQSLFFLGPSSKTPETRK